jgi:hypothetical protein
MRLIAFLIFYIIHLANALKQVEVDGETMPLSHMGPMIINKDGTARRIANWNLLTKKEKIRTWARVSERNIERVAALKANGKIDKETEKAILEEKSEMLLLSDKEEENKSKEDSPDSAKMRSMF